MNAILLLIIMKLEVISSMLFWSSLLFLLYLVAGFCRVWWGTIIGDECWSPYWRPLRRKTFVAAAIMLVSILLPSTREATVMYIVPAITQSSVWDRVFSHGVDQRKVDEAHRWIRDTVGK